MGKCDEVKLVKKKEKKPERKLESKVLVNRARKEEVGLVGSSWMPCYGDLGLTHGDGPSWWLRW